jgi:hypothetical protein
VPRKSIASMMVAQPRVDGRRARLQVPEDLSPPAKEVWSEIVSAVPGEHFRASDEPLLRSYAEACALADQAAAQLAHEWAGGRWQGFSLAGGTRKGTPGAVGAGDPATTLPEFEN